MPKSKLWKWFQNKVGSDLKDLMKTEPIRPFPFPDTFAARGKYLPAQPGDFAVVVPGGCVLIEVKTSEEHHGFASGLSKLMDKRQAAEHRLWHRTGNPSLVVFYSSLSERVEIWDGDYVANVRAGGATLGVKQGSPIFCDVNELKDHLKAKLVGR